jgi:hypothetical protein
MTRLSVRIGSAVMASLLVGACAGGGDGPGAPASPGTDPDPAQPGCEESFAGTFDAIQSVVFERRGCMQDACHGASASGGLDLRPEVAYRNLLNVPAVGGDMLRVEPGETSGSLLYRKLAEGTNPGSFAIPGAPMPSGLPPLSAAELELVRLWVYAGAPEEGVVLGTPQLVDACLPEPEPISIEPLPPPAPGEGVQFVMPSYLLPAGTELENCFAAYYDLRDQIPPEYLSPDDTRFRHFKMTMRQDPQSHHLIFFDSGIPLEDIHHPAFGGWACMGGERDGQACEPLDASSCGDGHCASVQQEALGACIGFGPPSRLSVGEFQGIGGAQRANITTQFVDGVYEEIPVRGIFLWNSHAFNLSSQDHRMNARINYLFADRQEHLMQRIPVQVGVVYIMAGQKPYTIDRYCNDWALPQGAHLFELTSHMHKRGKNFTIELVDGAPLYETFIYNDPEVELFEPPMIFDQTDPAGRTLRYCATYNNGVAPDGSPDPATVVRASRMPQNASPCIPEACTAGRVGEPCSGVDDDASCDSSPGAGDGECDACAINAGPSTENEMFVLLGRYFLPNE